MGSCLFIEATGGREHSSLGSWLSSLCVREVSKLPGREAEIQEELTEGWVRSIFQDPWETWVQVRALPLLGSATLGKFRLICPEML